MPAAVYILIPARPRSSKGRERGRHALLLCYILSPYPTEFLSIIIASGRVVKMPSDKAAICSPHKARRPLSLRRFCFAEPYVFTRKAPIRILSFLFLIAVCLCARAPARRKACRSSAPCAQSRSDLYFISFAVLHRSGLGTRHSNVFCHFFLRLKRKKKDIIFFFNCNIFLYFKADCHKF